MSRVPIRLRLALVFALAMAVLLGAAGAFLYLRLGSDLASSLDQSLRSRSQDLGALVRAGGSLRGTGSPLIERGESFAELVDAEGRVLDSSGSLGERRVLRSTELARAGSGPVFVDLPSAPGLDEPARLLAVPLDHAGKRLVLVVGETRENRAEALRSLRRAFAVGGPLALLLCALGGYLLAGAALRPIEEMRRRAQEISTTSLHERLPVPGSRDELARLGETLNQMLGRIEAGVARERRFVADASHELRSPLALLQAELELALRRSRSREDLERALRSAAEEADRLARIADDLLLLASSEQGRLPLRREPVAAAEVLGAVAERFAGRAEAASRGLTVDSVEEPVLEVDRLRLEQALGNLVDNALRYGEGGVALTAEAHNGAVELHVVDDGRGFPADFLGRAFERFSRAEQVRAEPGSGLGLAIVDTVARAHGGSAHVANRGEGGADVWISLPLSRVHRTSAQARPRPRI